MGRAERTGHKKRTVLIGLGYALFMVMLLFCAASSKTMAGCAGDCFSCHQELKADKDHKSLGTCVFCHNGTRQDYSLVPRMNINGSCGNRCFQCHHEWPVDSYHAPLDTCLSCHNR